MNGYTTRESGWGVVTAVYDRVTFEVKVRARADTGPAAKKKLEGIVAKISETCNALEKEGVPVSAGSKRAMTSVSPEHSYDQASRQNVFAGYAALYSLTFRTSAVDKASKIQDAFSSLQGVEVSEPQFAVKDLEDLHEEALKKAFQQVTARFTTGCVILGKDPGHFDITSWDVNYGDPSPGRTTPMALAGSANGGGGPIEVEPGAAEIRVQLTVTYSRRN